MSEKAPEEEKISPKDVCINAQQDAMKKLASIARSTRPMEELELRQAMEMLDTLELLRRAARTSHGSDSIVPEDPLLPLASIRKALEKRLRIYGG